MLKFRNKGIIFANKKMRDTVDLDVALPIEQIIEPKSKFSLGLAELWQYRELFYFFTWRDVKVRYKQAFLGFLWAVIQPFSMMVLFSLVFGKALKAPSDGIPYPIFVYSGLMLWNIFSAGLQNSATSMVTNANLIKKVYFPRLIVPMSSILVALFDFLMSLVVYAGLLVYYGYAVNILKIIVLLPIAVLLTVITTFGLGTFLAAFNVKYRDFQYTIPFLIQFLMFLNPVVYATSSFTGSWFNYVLAINPLAGAINLARSAFIDTPVRYELILSNFVVAIALFFVGIYTFRKTEGYFADIA